MSYRRYSRQQAKPQARQMYAKFAGTCACCGAAIKAGEFVTYYPAGTLLNESKGVIAHVGGLDGNSARCTSEIARGTAVDPGELAEDRWNEQYR